MYQIEIQRLNANFDFDTILTVGPTFDFIADAAEWAESNVYFSDAGTHPMQAVAVGPNRIEHVTLMESHPVRQVG